MRHRATRFDFSSFSTKSSAFCGEILTSTGSKTSKGSRQTSYCRVEEHKYSSTCTVQKVWHIYMLRSQNVSNFVQFAFGLRSHSINSVSKNGKIDNIWSACVIHVHIHLQETWCPYPLYSTEKQQWNKWKNRNCCNWFKRIILYNIFRIRSVKKCMYMYAARTKTSARIGGR